MLSLNLANMQDIVVLKDFHIVRAENMGAVITIIIITLIATIIMLVRHISLIKIIILIFLQHKIISITKKQKEKSQHHTSEKGVY